MKWLEIIYKAAGFELARAKRGRGGREEEGEGKGVEGEEEKGDGNEEGGGKGVDGVGREARRERGGRRKRR